jgi:hypothetical protein
VDPLNHVLDRDLDGYNCSSNISRGPREICTAEIIEQRIVCLLDPSDNKDVVRSRKPEPT